MRSNKRAKHSQEAPRSLVERAVQAVYRLATQIREGQDSLSLAEVRRLVAADLGLAAGALDAHKREIAAAVDAVLAQQVGDIAFKLPQPPPEQRDLIDVPRPVLCAGILFAGALRQ